MAYIGVLLIENHTMVCMRKSHLDKLEPVAFCKSAKGIRVVATSVGCVIVCLLYSKFYS